MAKVYFYYAAMNAGKSTVLLQSSYNYRERGMRTLLLTPSIDTRFGTGRIESRIGLRAGAISLQAADNIFARVSLEHSSSAVACVLIDEAQFLTPEQVWQIAEVADVLDIPVLCYGLRTDFRGELFTGSAELLAIADSLREIRTICHCGRKATMVVRQSTDGRALTSGDQVGIEKSMYVSLCRGHWEEETGRWPIAKPAAKLKAAKPKAKSLKKTRARTRTWPALRVAAASMSRPPKRAKR